MPPGMRRAAASGCDRRLRGRKRGGRFQLRPALRRGGAPGRRGRVRDDLSGALQPAVRVLPELRDQPARRRRGRIAVSAGGDDAGAPAARLPQYQLRDADSPGLPDPSRRSPRDRKRAEPSAGVQLRRLRVAAGAPYPGRHRGHLHARLQVCECGDGDCAIPASRTTPMRPRRPSARCIGRWAISPSTGGA